MKVAPRLAWLAAALLTGSPLLAARLAPRPLLVYAASSLTNVLDELGAAYTAASGHAVKFSYASSATLARQIEAGAPADLFLSADIEWMDYLKARGLINPASRIDLLGNRLVLVAPVDSSIRLTIAPGFSLLPALGKRRLAVGDPDSVPAGRYARSAMLSLGAWNEVADRLVRADNVRSALAFVDRGEAALGIVYETDALIDAKVRIVDAFPASSHPPITYPLALTTSAGTGSADFVAYLRSAGSRAVFRKYGFTVPP